jgi:hypothetical protein
VKTARPSLGRQVVAGLLLMSFPACTATVHRVNGPNIEAEIVGSDADGLQVASDQGTTYRLPRDSVAAIDHPGDVAAILGAIAIVVGGLVAVTASGARSDQARRKAFLPGLAVSSAGFGLLLGGIIPYSRSRTAAQAFLDAPPGQHALPAEQRWDRWGAAPAPAAEASKAAAPEPSPLTEALLPLPSWSDDPEPAATPSPAAAPPEPKTPVSAPTPASATAAPARPEPRPSPVFKPAPPAAPPR